MAIYRIADLNIKINNKYRYTTRICEKYRVDDECALIDFEVTPTAEDYEKDKACLSEYPDHYLESLSIYRQIARKISEYDGFVMHASVVEIDGKAYAFSAPSGTGKSTHSRLWLSAFPDRARIINGDKPIIRFIDGQTIVYGTPWCGKEGYNINTKAPLCGICFLERGENNEICEIDKDTALRRIFTQLLLPETENQSQLFFDMVDKLCQSVKFYKLKCNMDIDAALVAYEGMK